MIKTMLHNIKTGETSYGDEALFAKNGVRSLLYARFYE
jgi:hypothetical protein